VTPEFRAESHLALQRLSKDAGIPFPPAAIYGPLGESGDLLQQLHSLVKRARFDPNTASGLAARQHLSDKQVERFDKDTASGLAARQNLSDKQVERFDKDTASGLAARQHLSDKQVEHFDKDTASGLAARQNLSDKAVEQFNPNTASGLARGSGMSQGGHDAKAAQTRALKDLLVRRIQTHHEQPHFDVQSWIADLRTSQAKSSAAHVLDKANKGILPEGPHDVYRANMNAIIKAGGPPNERSEAFQIRKLTETLQHLIDTPYNGQDVRASARDANELQRIHTHLWWSEQGAVKSLNRKNPRVRKPRPRK
jgi:hypothetical protein